MDAIIIGVVCGLGGAAIGFILGAALREHEYNKTIKDNSKHSVVKLLNGGPR